MTGQNITPEQRETLLNKARQYFETGKAATLTAALEMALGNLIAMQGINLPERTHADLLKELDSGTFTAITPEQRETLLNEARQYLETGKAATPTAALEMALGYLRATQEIDLSEHTRADLIEELEAQDSGTFTAIIPADNLGYEAHPLTSRFTLYSHPILFSRETGESLSKRQRSRRGKLSAFVKWMWDQGLPWYAPDLAAYRDHLLETEGQSEGTVSTTLSYIRAMYQAALDDPKVEGYLYGKIEHNWPDLSPADQGEYVTRLLRLLGKAIHPRWSTVETTTVQDEADSETGTRLMADDAIRLMEAPGLDSAAALRNTAALVMLLCTGIREEELSNIQVEDLRQTFKGSLALRVKRGKGNKQRMVPYGELDWCLQVIDAWLRHVDITGPQEFVFRGFYRYKEGTIPSLRPGGLGATAIQTIVKTYSAEVAEINPDRYPGIKVDENGNGYVTVHDLRRTFARLMFDAGMQVEQLRLNMGHSDIQVTLDYIGLLSGEQRELPAAFGVTTNLLRRVRALNANSGDNGNGESNNNGRGIAR